MDKPAQASFKHPALLGLGLLVVFTLVVWRGPQCLGLGGSAAWGGVADPHRWLFET